jgi:hypothetical protein
MGAHHGTVALLGIVVKGVGALWARRRLRGRPFQWYCNARDITFVDPLHALLGLNELETGGTPEGRAEVDRVLCRAFLADLRDAYTTGWRARLRTGTCVAVLDNADSPVGHRFLEILAEERSRHAEDQRAGCDPLVVVATGRTRFPEFAHRTGRPLQTRSPRQATYADWAAGRDGSPKSWLYPVALGDLDIHEHPSEDHPALSLLARQWPSTHDVAHLVRKLHELTYGHLCSTSLVLHAVAKAVAGAAERVGASEVDLRGILDWPDPDHPTQTLAGGVIGRLLVGASQDLRNDLITCAAACDVGIPYGGGRSGSPEGPCSQRSWTSSAPQTCGRIPCNRPQRSCTRSCAVSSSTP